MIASFGFVFHVPGSSDKLILTMPAAGLADALTSLAATAVLGREGGLGNKAAENILTNAAGSRLEPGVCYKRDT